MNNVKCDATVFLFPKNIYGSKIQNNKRPSYVVANFFPKNVSTQGR